MRHLIIMVTIITVLVSLIFHQQVANVVLIVGYTAALLFATLAVLTVFFGGWNLAERVKLTRARRIEAEKSAHVQIVSDNGETWVRDTDSKATWRNLTGNPALYVNGKQHTPQDWEIELHRYRLAMQQKSARVINGTAELLPETTIASIELLTALDAVQRCLIVGASDAGKTTLLQWLVYRRQQTSKVVVIDPHSWPGKWAGCYVIGTGRNYGEIALALTGLVQVMTKRYDEIGRGEIGEGTHPKLTILIDEWRAIVQQLGKPASEAIKSLLTESRKAAFSVFVASHSDRAKPLGLEGEYDLKDGFAVVRLENINGQRKATIDTGSGEQVATLPGPFAAMPLVTSNSDFELDLTSQPTADEARILAMHDSGASLREISQAVYGEGKFGKHWNDKIKCVLDIYGMSSE